MVKYLNFITIFLIQCNVLTPSIWAQSKSRSGIYKDLNSVKIEIEKTMLTETSLELKYQIINNSNDDIWILAGYILQGSSKEEDILNAEIFMSENGRTIVTRRLYNLLKLTVLWNMIVITYEVAIT